MFLKNKSWFFIFILFLLVVFSSCQKVNWITIGVLDDQSGSFQPVTQQLANGRSLALSENPNLSTLPWKIRIKTNDTMNLPEKTANLMRELNDQTDIFLGVSSVECAQVAKYVAHYRKKVFLSEAIDDTIPDHVTSTLLIQQTPVNTGKLAVRYFFSNLKKDKMLLLYDQSNRSYQGIAEGFKTEGGLIGAQVFEEGFDSTLGKTDFNRLLTKIESINPQIIYCCVYEKDLEEILKLTLRTFEIPAILFINRIPDEISRSTNPDLYQQIFCILPFFDKKDSFISSDFYKNYVRKFNQNPDYYAACGYDEIIFIQALLKNNSNQTKKELFSHLKGSTWDEKLFVTGFKGFNNDGLAKRPVDIVKINNGKLSLLETFWSEVSLRR
jgi:ABC-type branched-subunit amino acid transport system substrate-binding protein